MSSKRPTVVVADEGAPGGRTALAAVRALDAAGYRALTTVAGERTLASSSRRCAGTVRVPQDGMSDWVAAINAAAESGALVLPASDSAVVALGLPGAPLVDKRVLRLKALEAGLPTPSEQRFASRAALAEASHELAYPVVVKPALRDGLDPMMPVQLDDADGIAALPGDRPFVVQPFLHGEMKAFCGLVSGGRLVAAVHQRYERIWPVTCGVSSAAVTVEADKALEERILALVEDHEGIVQVQFIDNHVIDVNPRAYGSLPLAVRAGVNLPALWCETVAGGAAPAAVVRARVGVRYRWEDGDARAVLSHVRSGRTSVTEGLRALRPHRDTAHSIMDWRDPVPVLVRLAQAVGRAG